MKHFMPNYFLSLTIFNILRQELCYAYISYFGYSATNNGVLNKNKDCQSIKMVFQTNGKIV